MRESIGLLVKAVDNFGFLSEDFGFDLLSYEYSPRSAGNFKLLFENREIRLMLTLEKGQLYIHIGSSLYPEEYHSMLRIVRYIARRGGGLSNDEQDTDYWRRGMKLDSQFGIAARQLEVTLGAILGLFSGAQLETTRLELKTYSNRVGQADAKNGKDGKEYNTHP